MIRGDSSGSFNGIYLSMNNSGVVNADIKNGGSNVLALTSTATFNDGKWHHFVFTFNGTNNAFFYIDGTVVGSGDPNASWSLNGQPVRRGTATDSFWNTFTGSLDDVRIYNRVLSYQEIQQLYAIGR